MDEPLTLCGRGYVLSPRRLGLVAPRAAAHLAGGVAYRLVGKADAAWPFEGREAIAQFRQHRRLGPAAARVLMDEGFKTYTSTNVPNTSSNLEDGISVDFFRVIAVK